MENWELFDCPVGGGGGTGLVETGEKGQQGAGLEITI